MNFQKVVFNIEMGIESPTIIGRDGNVFPEIYEMPNGCICCSSKTDLFRLIEFFCEKKPEVEYLLIEANGLADIADVNIYIFFFNF